MKSASIESLEVEDEDGEILFFKLGSIPLTCKKREREREGEKKKRNLFWVQLLQKTEWRRRIERRVLNV